VSLPPLRPDEVRVFRSCLALSVSMLRYCRSEGGKGGTDGEQGGEGGGGWEGEREGGREGGGVRREREREREKSQHSCSIFAMTCFTSVVPARGHVFFF
jgi:hypothetical protein